MGQTRTPEPTFLAAGTAPGRALSGHRYCALPGCRSGHLYLHWCSTGTSSGTLLRQRQQAPVIARFWSVRTEKCRCPACALYLDCHLHTPGTEWLFALHHASRWQPRHALTFSRPPRLEDRNVHLFEEERLMPGQHLAL